MKKPKVLIVTENKEESAIIKEYFTHLPEFPDIRYLESSGSRLSSLDLRDNLVLTYLSKSVHESQPQLVNHIRSYVREINPDLPIIIGEGENMKSGKLRNQLSNDIAYLIENSRLTKRINIMVNGGGVFVQEMLRLLKNESWANIDLFSASAAECRGEEPKPGEFSYSAIINNVGLEEMNSDKRLRVHNSLDSWLASSDIADMVLFASGPHIDYTAPNSIRGKGSEEFYNKLFHETLSNLQKCCLGLKERRYSENLWILSNPIGSLCLAANSFGATKPENIGSVTCDGLRAAKLMATVLGRDYSTRETLKLERVTVRDIYEFPVLGEHHSPVYLYDYCIVKSANQGINSLYSLFPKSKERVFQEWFEESLKEKAVHTMLNSHSLGIGYSEAPETVVRVLRRIANFQKPDNYESCYIYNKRSDSYLMRLANYDSKTQEYEELVKLTELPKKVQGTLRKQASIQRKTVRENLVD